MREWWGGALFEALPPPGRMPSEGINVNQVTDPSTGLRFEFPAGAAEARARAQEFRSLSPDERWLQISQLMEIGMGMVQDSPRRAEIERRMEAQEKEWQRLQAELFAQHAK